MGRARGAHGALGGAVAFWSRWFGGSTVQDPREVLASLDAALVARDADRFATLCATHVDAFPDWFPAWVEQAGPDRAQVLLAIAEWLAEERGDRAVLDRWFPPTERDGSAQVARTLEQLDGIGKRGAAIARGQDFLSRAEPTPHGRLLVASALGRLLWLDGRQVEADSVFAEAAALAGRLGDAGASARALEAMFELARARGDAATAAVHADGAARAWRAAGEARRAAHWLRRSTWVRQGEPPVRAVVAFGDGTCDLPEAVGWPLPEGAALTLLRGRPLHPEAAALLARAHEVGVAGDIEGALGALAKAAAVDPHAPEPWYEQGLIHFDRDALAEAGTCFARVERLAPGWRDVRAHGWLRSLVAEGRVGRRVWRFRRVAAAGLVQPSELVGEGSRLIEKHPLAPLLLDLGRALEALGDVDEARAVYARGLDAEGEASTRTELLVRLAALEPPEAARQRLETAVTLSGHPLAAAEARARLARLAG